MDPLMLQAGNQIAGTVLGLALQGVNDKRQLRQQQKLNEQQLNMDKALGIFNREQAMKIWEDTNYQAQTDQMRKAGLNVGLMYKSAGGGGITMQPNSNFNAPNAPTGGGEIGMGLQMGLMTAQVKANIDLANAQANLANAEADKKRGIDTKEGETRVMEAGYRMENLKAITENAKLQSAILDAEGKFKQIQTSIAGQTQDELVKQVLLNNEKLANEIKITGNQAKISDSTIEEAIKQIQQTTIEQGLRISLIKENIIKTGAETEEIQANIKRMATEIVQKWTSLGQTERELLIKKDLADFTTSTAMNIKQWTDIATQLWKGSINFMGAGVGRN